MAADEHSAASRKRLSAKVKNADQAANEREFPFVFIAFIRMQPIMLRVLPVEVRPRELAVCPRSYIRRLGEATQEVKARM